MLICIIAAAAAIGVVVLAAVAFRLLGRGASDQDPKGATAGHAGGMLSALFLLVFAIAVVVPWTTADAARQNTYDESHAIVQAYWSASGLPAPARDRVQNELRGYVVLVRQTEWPLMGKGQLSPQGWTLLDMLRGQVAQLRLTGAEAADARNAVLDQVGNISAARQLRMMDAKWKSPAGVLAITILAGLTVTVFPLLAGAQPRGMTMLPLLAMASLLGVGIYLIFDMSHVFAGALSVKPDAFAFALQEIQRAGAG